uniref:hypothetical protein n=1 Tax=Pseudomonas lundensis TaxID=86185 RepID=UPI0028D3D22C|nr:hypothetical protein [Pseudomonas lundensis]
MSWNRYDESLAGNLAFKKEYKTIWIFYLGICIVLELTFRREPQGQKRAAQRLSNPTQIPVQKHQGQVGVLAALIAGHVRHPSTDTDAA